VSINTEETTNLNGQ